MDKDKDLLQCLEHEPPQKAQPYLVHRVTSDYVLHLTMLHPSLSLEQLFQGVREGEYYVRCDELVDEDGTTVAALEDVTDTVIDTEVVAYFDGEKEYDLTL